jgi:putative ABC transport system substrate-binding protein
VTVFLDGRHSLFPLRASKSAGVAVEQPTKFELVINMKTAKSLGLRIPPS